jgi:hypothetical protein
MKTPPPLCLELRRSRLALAAVVAMHAATAALLLALPLSPAVCAAGGIGVALAGALALRSLAGPARAARLALGLDRRLAVTRRDGRTRAGEVLASSYVGAWLTTIVWRPDGARFARALIVVPDVMPAEDFRRLRVMLRYGGPVTPVVA